MPKRKKEEERGVHPKHDRGIAGDGEKVAFDLLAVPKKHRNSRGKENPDGSPEEGKIRGPGSSGKKGLLPQSAAKQESGKRKRESSQG